MRPCTVCARSDREAIDRALATRTLRSLAAETGLSRSALQRHKAHVSGTATTGTSGTSGRTAAELAEVAGRLDRNAVKWWANVVRPRWKN